MNSDKGVEVGLFEGMDCVPPAGPRLRQEAIRTTRQLLRDVERGIVSFGATVCPSTGKNHTSRMHWVKETAARLDRLRELHRALEARGR